MVFHTAKQSNLKNDKSHNTECETCVHIFAGFINIPEVKVTR